jgi:hypothetical protein
MAASFTVTQVTYNFTASITRPLELTLVGEDPPVTNVTDQTAVVTVNNTLQPVSISGSGNAFNQSLNTGDNVGFQSVTTPSIYGTAGQPVVFPNGFSAPNLGTVFINSIDFGQIR